MSWDLQEIRTKIRILTSRPSVNQISDAAIDAYINEYYTEVLATEVPDVLLEGPFTQSVTNPTDLDRVEYTYSQAILGFLAPFTIDGYPIEVLYDEELFLSKYPLSAEAEQQMPATVLINNGKLTFAPAPVVGESYTFRCQTHQLQTTLVNDADTTTRVNWGRLVAVGASILLLRDYKQFEQAAMLEPSYSEAKARVERGFIIHRSGQRGTPTF